MSTIAPSKQLQIEVVQLENRVELLKSEVEKLANTRDAIQAEIDRKTADYSIFMAQKDADSKKLRNDVVVQQDKLAKDKSEFQAILLQFAKDKESFSDRKKIVDDQNANHEEKLNNIRQFVISVQRAVSLLGL